MKLILKNSVFKRTARLLLLLMIFDIIRPTISWALTSGPTQPEMTSFEPVSTTDMVDLFTGDFTYNIPLLDVEGYPINISYHSGSNIEQEASWVGLGWNINPGSLVRSVRGVPDDFNGDRIEKDIHIKPEKNTKVNVGLAAELAGFKGLGANAGLYVNSSNYRGLSAGLDAGASIRFGMGSAGVNMGVNIGVGSQSGADINLNASVGFSSSARLGKEQTGSLGFGLGGATGYNSRGGWRDLSLSGNVSAQVSTQNAKIDGGGAESHMTSVGQASFSTTIPIGLQNFVPVITNKSTLLAISGKLGLGFEAFSAYPHADLGLTYSELSFDRDGSIDAYGYLNLQNAGPDDMLDFTRDRDGMFNKTMPNLPAGNMTYDIYSASAQGGGGLFRPFRNDFGSVYDPELKDKPKVSRTVGLEAGLGNLFEVAGDYDAHYTKMESGPWDEKKQSFLGRSTKINSAYEPTYFKQAGELTEVNESYYNGIGKTDPVTSMNESAAIAALKQKRNPRGRLIYFHNAAEASNREVSTSEYIQNYTDTAGLSNGVSTSKTNISRTDGLRDASQISEVVQIATDGTRFNYGIPAMNNVQREYAFSVGSGATKNIATSEVNFDTGDNTGANNKGIENYYSSTVTPAYAHSYLLTSVLSTDYVDLKGDGITDDDLGTYTKFNYSKKSSDYRWRFPYQKEDSTNLAQLNQGYLSDTHDDKGYYTVGSKEIWMLHSIETKNYCAEFYTSPRKDALGVKDAILQGSTHYANQGAYAAFVNDLTENGRQHKLDSIVLYNKHERFIKGSDAVPIKTVIFTYDYSLCKGVPNHVDAGSLNPDQTGKLTLKRIYTKYGLSDKNTISPYKFTYSAFNPDYNLACKNRWGAYKSLNTNLPNAEYPYVDQDDPDLDTYASAWQLTKVQLPSGGFLEVEYEADDYAYVQDRRAMEMFEIYGAGYSPDANTANKLYAGRTKPFDYIYFTRKSNEVPLSTLKQKYLGTDKTIYYNFAVDISKNGKYEPVRGYAKVLDIGACPNNSSIGYIKLQTRAVHRSSAVLNPIAYNALNLGRSSLNHLFYPGSDPNTSDLNNIIKGLAAAAVELINIFKNPMETFVSDGKAQVFNKSKSFVRLETPSMSKKGGGNRVKSLVLNDAWSGMVSNEGSSTYGSTYEYTLDDEKYGEISSGVASYEPMAGADENPFRQLAKYYEVSQGSKFPPNAPIELLQEGPVGEALYPSARVGYSRVEVKSIHAATARSAKVRTVSEFYTAKDFPLQAKSTGIKILENKTTHKSILKSVTNFKAEQGYSLVFNDMHGKPKRTVIARMRDVNNINKDELVSSVLYKYKTNAQGELDNNVQVLEYENSQGIVQKTKLLGQEVDVTKDCREKTEQTTTTTMHLNLNTFLIGVFPIPLPTGFGYGGAHARNFHSNVVTKVVQQYGVLEEVETVSENAKTVLKNELFDPVSGRTLMSSINNEFKDREYSMSYPGYWSNIHLAGAYQNIGYEEDNITIDFDHNTSAITDSLGTFIPNTPKNFTTGDELLVRYNGQDYKLWVVGAHKVGAGQYELIVDVRNYRNPPANWGKGHAAWTNCEVKIIRSGRRNVLENDVYNVTSLDHPVSNNLLRFAREKALSASASHYADWISVWITPEYDNEGYAETWVPQQGSPNVYLAGPYKYNPWVSGFARLGVSTDYVWRADRNYQLGHSRSDGIFDMNFGSLKTGAGFCEDCPGGLGSVGLEMLGNSHFLDHSLALGQTQYPGFITPNSFKSYSPYGTVLRSRDHVGVSSGAHYGYDHTLTTAVATNADCNEFIYDGFEDYELLKAEGLYDLIFSPFKDLFVKENRFPGNDLYKSYVPPVGASYSLSDAEAHAGLYSLSSGGGQMDVGIPISNLAFQSVNANISHFKSGAVNFTKKNVISVWVKKSNLSIPTAPSVTISHKNVPTVYSLERKTNSIEGWFLFEIETPAYPLIQSTGLYTWEQASITLHLPAGAYYDDIRCFPSSANMKSYAYHPINQKLMATLDENNFATFYEYDQEGILVRTKKETEKGILTLKETRMSKKKN